MNKLIKPKALKVGSTIAAVTTSAAVANIFPHQYEYGKKQLEETFKVNVIAAPHALETPDALYNHPEKRAADLMWAFENPDIDAIFAIIGGDDSIRLLPYIDFDVIRKNPKIFMGYSDPTSVHFMCYKAGLSSIYGPTIMAGFGENGGILPYMENSVRRTLFSSQTIGEVKPNSEGWTEEFLDWADPENQKIKRKLTPSTPINVLQGTSKVQGHLLGGCYEVLEMINGTSLWPSLSEWDGALFFIETSEGAPPEEMLLYWMRSLAAQGIIQKLAGIIIGRPRGAKGNLNLYEKPILTVVKECGRHDMPVLSQMDFGHTDPMFLIPYGAQAEIDPRKATFSILESAVQEA